MGVLEATGLLSYGFIHTSSILLNIQSFCRFFCLFTARISPHLVMDVCIATDTVGNFYIGYTSSTVRVQKLDDSRSLVWSITIDNTDGWTRPYLAVDSTGAVYLSYEVVVEGSDREVCVAKIASDGTEFLWNRSYGTLATDCAAKMAIDGSNNVILVFATTGVIAGGTASGGSDIAVFKLNPDGDVLWSLQHPSLNTAGDDSAPTVTVAPSGALLVSYQTTSAADPAGGVVTSSLTPGGTVTWSRNFPEAPDYIPCFLAGTPVRTRRGIIPIEKIVVGDEVLSGKGTWTTVRWVRITPMIASSTTIPYSIPRGWGVGSGKATASIFISPNHCVAVPGYGMIRAANLGLNRATHLREGDVFLYYNLEVDDWENIVIAGIEVESLAPRKLARLTLTQIAQQLVSQYADIASIPFASYLKNTHLLSDGTVVVPFMPKSAIANRRAVTQELAYRRVHSRAVSS